MKAISLYQPWATLIAIGAKKIETRSWSTRYRGRLAIHATLTKKYLNNELLFKSPFHEALSEEKFDIKRENFPLGAIIAICELKACFPIHEGPLLISDQEKTFGDYTPGRFMWMLDKVISLDPITIKGAQGLWNIPNSYEEEIWKRRKTTSRKFLRSDS